MDVSFQPKSTMPDAPTGPTLKDILSSIGGLYVGEKKSVFTILLTLILVATLGGVGALYMVDNSMTAQVEAKKAELNQKDGQMISPTKLAEIVNMSNRVKAVGVVVKGQPFMTTFLKLLEYSVEDDVTFKKTSLASARVATGGEAYTFSVEAAAKNYAAVLNQVQTMRTTAPYSKFFSNIVMSGFGVDKKGSITFKLAGDVAVQGMMPEEAEKELLKVLSPEDLPQPAESTTTSGSSTTP